MNILIVVGVGAALLLLASRLYPFWISRVFRLDDTSPPPSEQFADGKDYVKTPTQVVFAHHFASIAGAGPIVGPIMALAFGWGPAWLWIIFGGIMIGGVHDMSAMAVSMREGGKSIAEIARRTLGTSGYVLFVLILILVLCLINAIFLNLSATALTSLVPMSALQLDPSETVLRMKDLGGEPKALIGGIATTSVFLMTAFAPVLGYLVYKRGLKGLSAFAIAAAVCVISVIIGFSYPIDMYSLVERFFPPADPANTLEVAQNVWRVMLTIYVFIGCWIPVWMVLQPRDFSNVQILYAALILLLAGACVAGLGGQTIAMDQMATLEAGRQALKGPIWPFLFITIACGAISGFHSLVSTGTTVKQIPRETDCRRIGYNAMLLESLLALLVLVAVGSQLTHGDYMSIVFPEQGRGNAVLAFALGCGRTFSNLGIPIDIGSVLGILILEGFLITTLDTSVRLCRYLFEELWNCIFRGRAPLLFRLRLFNTAVAVAGMLLFALSALYQHIWTIFGSGNQLMAALALTTVSIWLLQRGRRWLFAALPAVFMTITTLAALWTKMNVDFAAAAAADEPQERWGRSALAYAGVILLVLAVGFIIVGIVRLWGELRQETRDRPTPV